VFSRSSRRTFACAALVTAAVALTPGLASARSTHHVSHPAPTAPTRFYVPPPHREAIQQGLQLLRQHRVRDALRIAALESKPKAVWVTKGTPSDARAAVSDTIRRARLQRAVPVLVAYNVPGRDCGGLSAGGALTTAEYKAWVDGFASGIGANRAIVILEPDGLGLLPSNCGAGYPFTDAQRYEELNYAVDRLGQGAKTSVYLDGTHSAWLGVGDISLRLATAGVQRATGFFTNVSNYRLLDYERKYATWISKCIAFANNPEEGGWRLGHYDWCASQYFSPLAPPGTPVNPNDISTWVYTDQWFDANLGTAQPTAHFVIDTSRNGQGPWTPPNGVYSDPQDWCNPPGRGVGVRPTTNSGSPLGDALLWVKVPGESDGTCTRGAPAGSVDPEWGIVDPAAGQWFPQQALQLAQLASPPLL
jgi:endoglucanase